MDTPGADLNSLEVDAGPPTGCPGLILPSEGPSAPNNDTAQKDRTSGGSGVAIETAEQDKSSPGRENGERSENDEQCEESKVEDLFNKLDIHESVDSYLFTSSFDFQVDNDGDTVLHTAILSNCCIDIIRSLLFRYVNVLPYHCFIRLINYQNRFSYQTPLHLASLLKRPDVVVMLVDLGARANCRDSRLRTPLHIACESMDPRLLEAFFKAEADIHPEYLDLHNNEALTCLHVTVVYSNEAMAAILLKHGADINARDGHSGRTALHFAAELGNVGFIRFLMTFLPGLENRGLLNPDMRTLDGTTALELARMRGRTEVVQLLEPVSEPVGLGEETHIIQ